MWFLIKIAEFGVTFFLLQLNTFLFQKSVRVFGILPVIEKNYLIKMNFSCY